MTSNMDTGTGLETCEHVSVSPAESASDEEEELLTLRLAALKSIRFKEHHMAPLKVLAASQQQLKEPDPHVINSDIHPSLLKADTEERHLPQNPIQPSLEMFRCAACPGPVGLLPAFPTFKQVRLHSMNIHLVHLERAVQASTLLPTTLMMYVCKLCPEETENVCLHVNEIIAHLQKIHSEFFVETWWKEFTEVQCRVCEMVIEENTIDSHINSFHPCDLFAKIGDIVKEEMDQNENLGSAQDANQISLTTDFQAVWESFRPDNLITKYFPPISRPNLVQDIQTGDTIGNNQMLPPTNLIPGVKTLDLKPNEVVMIGIKKGISGESIRKFFMVNGIQLEDVRISNGSGVVTFKNQKDAEDYGGKDIEVDDCVIRTCIRKDQTRTHSKNVLYMRSIPKTVSLDDLHDFFWSELCVIDDIGLMNGQGKVFFRQREDVEAFAGRVIKVKDTKIKLYRSDGTRKASVGGGGRHDRLGVRGGGGRFRGCSRSRTRSRLRRGWN